MKDTEYPEQKQGMTITNECYYCMIVNTYDENYKCRSCVEDKEWKDDDIAHEIVDEGNMQYSRQWLRTDDQPSASEWVSSETYVQEQTWETKMTEIWDGMTLIELSVKFIDKDEPYMVRKEFTPPIVQLIDGGVYEELWELDDYTQRTRETQCKWCNILTPKMFNDCQSCDKPLENNLA